MHRHLLEILSPKKIYKVFLADCEKKVYFFCSEYKISLVDVKDAIVDQRGKFSFCQTKLGELIITAGPFPVRTFLSNLVKSRLP